MILYELRCPSEHFFEGWFRNSAFFEEQSIAGEIACPICGAHEITKAPMAPRLTRPHDSRHDAAESGALKLLHAMRRAIETECDNVGDRFAEEARKIHYGETDPRSICGRTSPAEAEALAEEGVEFGCMPWLPVADG